MLYQALTPVGAQGPGLQEAEKGKDGEKHRRAADCVESCCTAGRRCALVQCSMQGPEWQPQLRPSCPVCPRPGAKTTALGQGFWL